MKSILSTSFLLLFTYTTTVFAMYNPYDMPYENPYEDYYDPYYEMNGPGFLKTPYNNMMEGPPSYPPSPFISPPLPPPQPNPASTQNAWNNFVQCYLRKCLKADEPCFKECLNNQGSSSLSSLNPPSRNNGGSEEGGDDDDNDDQA